MKIAKTAPDALRILWADGFFKTNHSHDETVLELSKKGYNFPYDVMRMALSRADFLTRTGGRGDGKFIQKYPYNEEDTHGRTSQKD
ncbi:MAG: hypothetical protein PHY95_00200 [Candidatus ainarchaeum sp.]|nr:hypothetical protein [Candidatus ainarchaeum sp.]